MKTVHQVIRFAIKSHAYQPGYYMCTSIRDLYQINAISPGEYRKTRIAIMAFVKALETRNGNTKPIATVFDGWSTNVGIHMPSLTDGDRRLIHVGVYNFYCQLAIQRLNAAYWETRLFETMEDVENIIKHKYGISHG